MDLVLTRLGKHEHLLRLDVEVVLLLEDDGSRFERRWVMRLVGEHPSGGAPLADVREHLLRHLGQSASGRVRGLLHPQLEKDLLLDLFEAAVANVLPDATGAAGGGGHGHGHGQGCDFAAAVDELVGGEGCVRHASPPVDDVGSVCEGVARAVSGAVDVGRRLLGIASGKGRRARHQPREEQRPGERDRDRAHGSGGRSRSQAKQRHRLASVSTSRTHVSAGACCWSVSVSVSVYVYVYVCMSRGCGGRP